MQDEVVTIATFPYETPAEMAKIKLEAEGVESIVVGGSPAAVGTAPYQPESMLMVRSEDAERARHILQHETKAPPRVMTWEIVDEVVLSMSCQQAFEVVQAVMNRMGHVKEIDESSFTMAGTIPIQLGTNVARIWVRVEADGQQSRIDIRGHKKYVPRFLKELNNS